MFIMWPILSSIFSKIMRSIKNQTSNIVDEIYEDVLCSFPLNLTSKVSLYDNKYNPIACSDLVVRELVRELVYNTNKEF